jgi:EAL domain-containing protein (putative c-di-GMP-specific phosphodiesterase class I)
MEYLRHFPFDMIQFDREFTQEINNKKTVAVFRSFIAMAKEMEIITVAKWVDSPQQIQRLKELGIDYIQGYATGTIYNEEEFIRAYNPMKEV